MNHHESALRAAFLQCGWSAEHLSPAIASKSFDTACTPKLAHVYLYPSGMLWSHYLSEGRNALAVHFWHVDTTDPERLQAHVAGIDREICAAVDATYARRLWLLGVRPHRASVEAIAAH